MTRSTRLFLALALAAASFPLAACEDPIIVVGDLPGIMRRVAGVPNRLGSDVDPGSARQTLLAMPRGLAVADDGTLYIADTGNGRIVAVTPTGEASVIADAAGCEGACLVSPQGVALAPDGSLWVADPGAHRLFRYDPETQQLEVRAGTGVAGNSPDVTPALEAMLNAPTGIAITGNGTVYFSERNGHRVRWITSQGGLRTIAGTGEAGYADGSPATEALLNGPSGLAVAGTLLYVADEQNNRVRVVNINGGSIADVAGNGVAAYSETDTIALSAKLNRPRALALTPDARQLFIADALNDRVRVVALTTGRISSFAGTGDPTFVNEGEDAAETGLEDPAGVAVHPEGILFIADTGHQIVWRTPLRF